MLKYCAIFSLCAGLSLAADFMTGMAARAVLGQTTFTTQDSGASNLLLGGVGGLAYGNNTLFVTDSNRLGNLPLNNRVLMFNNVSQMIPGVKAEIGPNTGRCPVCVQGATMVLGQPADLVLGQPDFVTVAQVVVTSSSLRGPQGVW